MAEAGENADLSFAATVRGYHVYRRVWLPHLGQRLKAGSELGNAEDHFAIAVYSLGERSDHTLELTIIRLVPSLQRTIATAG